jgi:hypothetical protein
VVWALIALAVCGCMICTPPPTPSPPETSWEPSGAALWATGTLRTQLGADLHTAGQGGMHLLLGVAVGPGGYSTTTEVRFRAVARRGGALVGAAHRTATLTPPANPDAGVLADGGFESLAEVPIVLCPPSNGPVLGQSLEVEVWAAREGDHQLLERTTLSVTPVCPGGGCSVCN